MKINTHNKQITQMIYNHEKFYIKDGKRRNNKNVEQTASIQQNGRF